MRTRKENYRLARKLEIMRRNQSVVVQCIKQVSPELTKSGINSDAITTLLEQAIFPALNCEIKKPTRWQRFRYFILTPFRKG